MIEVVIDFNEIELKDYGDTGYVPVNMKESTMKYISHKLNIPVVSKWDAFSDNFDDLFHKLPPKDYKYKDNDNWCWKNKKEYENNEKYFRSIGLLNKDGEKDDIRLVFVNFYPFYKKYRSISNDLLEIVLENVNFSNQFAEEEECLKYHWIKMVLEIRS